VQEKRGCLWALLGLLVFSLNAHAATDVPGVLPGPPYQLDQADETYILIGDISTPGTAVEIIAPGVTFDLNGHTIVYQQVPALTNPGFEEGQDAAPNGWDLSGAPGAERRSTFIRPMVGGWYLYVPKRLADQVVVSDWVELPAGTVGRVHFVRGDASWKYRLFCRLEVEHETAGILTAIAGTSEYYAGFQMPETGRVRVRWTWKHEDHPEWQPDTEYAVGQVVITPKVPGVCYELVSVASRSTGASGGMEPSWPTDIEATVNDAEIVWQAFEKGLLDYCPTWEPGKTYRLGDHVHPTTPNGVMYKAVQISVPGAKSGSTEPEWTVPPRNVATVDGDLLWQLMLDTDAHIDELWVGPGGLRTRANYGVSVMGYWGENEPINCVVRNGTVRQGSGRGFLSHGIRVQGKSTVTVEGMQIETNGLESAGICAAYSPNSILRNNTIKTTGQHKFNRHQLSAAIFVVHCDDAEVSTNQVDSGRAWGGIYLAGDRGRVLGNIVDTKSVTTNHYGIMFYGNAGLMKGNTVNADPGQGLRTEGDGNVMEGNTVTIHSVAPNWDVGRLSLDGIRINDYNNGTDKNLLIRNNTITVYGKNSALYERQPQILCGICNVTNGAGNVYEGNVIKAVKVDPEVTVCGLMPGSKDEEVIWRENTVESDEYNVMFGAYPGLSWATTFVGNTFIRGTNAIEAYATLAAQPRTSDFLRGTRFVGTQLGNGATLRDPAMPWYRPYSYSVANRLTVTVIDADGLVVPNATVVILRNGDVVTTTMTGADGKTSSIELSDFDWVGTGESENPNIVTEYNPYMLRVTAAGKVVEKKVTVDRDKTVVMAMNGIEPEPEPEPQPEPEPEPEPEPQPDPRILAIKERLALAQQILALFESMDEDGWIRAYVEDVEWLLGARGSRPSAARPK